MNEMSEYYRMLKASPPAPPKKQPHKGNWSLFLHIGGIAQPVLIDKPYALCVERKKQLERDPSVRRGTLKIQPHNPQN